MPVKFPHHNAAFINSIWEEGTKEEAIQFLQEVWNELCEVKKELRGIKDLSSDRKRRLIWPDNDNAIQKPL